MNWSEKKIQLAVTDLLKKGNFKDHIGNTGFIDQILRQDRQLDFTSTFFIDFHLDYHYARIVKNVIESLKNYRVVIEGPG